MSSILRVVRLFDDHAIESPLNLTLHDGYNPWSSFWDHFDALLKIRNFGAAAETFEEIVGMLTMKEKIRAYRHYISYSSDVESQLDIYYGRTDESFTMAHLKALEPILLSTVAVINAYTAEHLQLAPVRDKHRVRQKRIVQRLLQEAQQRLITLDALESRIIDARPGISHRLNVLRYQALSCPGGVPREDNGSIVAMLESARREQDHWLVKKLQIFQADRSEASTILQEPETVRRRKQIRPILLRSSLTTSIVRYLHTCETLLLNTICLPKFFLSTIAKVVAVVECVLDQLLPKDYWVIPDIAGDQDASEEYFDSMTSHEHTIYVPGLVRSSRLLPSSAGCTPTEVAEYFGQPTQVIDCGLAGTALISALSLMQPYTHYPLTVERYVLRQLRTSCKARDIARVNVVVYQFNAAFARVDERLRYELEAHEYAKIRTTLPGRGWDPLSETTDEIES